MMDASTKARWTAALRSGDYEQGIGRFEQDGKFCCLGVLCDVMGQPTTASADATAVVGNWTFVGDLLDSRNEPLTRCQELAAMNDAGNSFPEIADWIDANIKPTQGATS